MWWVYLLKCFDDSIYTGSTNNLNKRINAHNAGTASKYTRARLPVVLLKSFECTNRSEACKLEYKIKQLSRQEKLKLIGEKE